MVAQQFTLFNIAEFIPGKIKTKRVHYKIPTYIKRYSFTSVNPLTNELQYLGDEKHIFRVKALQRIYSNIYDYCNINPFEQFEKKELDGLMIYKEDMQAEIPNTWNLPLKDRVTIHIRLLRLLRKGFSVKEAMRCLK